MRIARAVRLSYSKGNNEGEKRTRGARYEAKVEQVRGEHEGELERLRSDLEQTQTDIERLRNEKQEFVEYVEEERSWREQPLATRLKWWMFGKGAE